MEGDRLKHASPARELDIIELISILWRGKWLILLVVALALVAAVGWLSTKKDVYLVEAIVDEADNFTVDVFQPSKLHQFDINPSGNSEGARGKSDGGAYQVRGIDSSKLYNNVSKYLKGRALNQDYWNIKKGSVVDLSDPRSEAYKEYMRFYDKLSWGKIDGKSESSIKFSLLTIDPVAGVKELTEYIDYLNSTVVADVISTLSHNMQTKLENLDLDYSLMSNQERLKQADRLTLLKEARNIASELKLVQMPFDDLSGLELDVFNSRLYLLGVQALDAEIKLIEKRKDLAAYVPMLRVMEVWKKQIENDLHRYSGIDQQQARVLAVIQAPVSSAYPVKPNRVLTIIASGVFGVVIGAILVLLRSALQFYARKENGA